MACCVVIAVFLGLIRRTRYRLLPGVEPALEYAPIAARPGPGESLTRSIAVRPAAPSIGALMPGPVLAYVAAGVVVYTASVAALLALGVATEHAGRAWLARDILMVLVAVLALTVAFRVGTSAAVHRGAHALVGIGGAWVVLGLLDMHGFRLFDIAHGNIAADVVFHGAGSVAVSIGLARLLARDRALARRTAHTVASS